MPAVKRKRSGDSTLSPAPVSPDLGAEEGKLEPKTGTGAEASLMGLEQYRLPLYPGEVYYIPDFLSTTEANGAYTTLSDLETWEHPILRVYGKQGVVMKYSGTQSTINSPMPPALDELRLKVEKLVGHVPVCMLNRYDAGDVYIGKHSDTPDNDVIASVSLGVERTFIFSPKDAKGVKSGRERLKIKLRNGSLVIMAGDTQAHWKHEIPKEPKIKEGRISLTFRRLKSMRNGEAGSG